jgi:myo-inositol 2-dehydrogenase/D-chiro-inositol 1-dehydrogenase
VLPEYIIKGPNPWKYEIAEPNDMYMQEHRDLIASIRAGKPYNELKSVTESSLTAIMGRMSAYTGKTITWEEALNAPESLMPQSLTWGPMPMPPVPMPGIATE